MNRVALQVCIALLLAGLHANSFAQQSDSIIHELETITVKSYRSQLSPVQQLESLHQLYITVGKKHEVISLQGLPANLAEKTGRQIFAKVPGAFIYDMDGSGNQLNIATRGLDPHRSWEYNVRQNGIMTNSDIYAYPASHYSPPMEAVQRVELIRGTASLQYGAQFGGMINYQIKEADTTKAIGFESINAVGSFGLLSTYNAVGGRKGKWSYYAYYHRRTSDGYRDDARSAAQAQYVCLNYFPSKKLSARLELGRSEYLHQNPGPLTDAMFTANPRQSTRSRNYFRPDIYVPSFTLNWEAGPSTRLQWISSAVLGTRGSIQFIGFASTPDTILETTRQYLPRQVDIDNFNSYTTELRLQHSYSLLGLPVTLVSGLRYINNNLHRRQLGKGTTGTDFDLTITEPQFGRDVRMQTENVALFAENLIQFSPRLDVSVGVRIENGLSRVTGVIAYLPNERVPQQIEHNYPLLGLSMQYRINTTNRLYGGWSQAYRPVIFADLIPASPLEQSDVNMQDAFGYNLDIGLKGRWQNRLIYDISLFRMRYNNRIGSLVLVDTQGQSYVFKTNIGDSRTDGLEVYAEYKLVDGQTSQLSVFSATAYFNGIYLNGELRDGTENIDIGGNTLETLPRWISRNGCQFEWKGLSVLLQFSYVAASFSDALNTAVPSANGGRGPVPAYSVWDLNTALHFGKMYTFKFGVNNLLDAQYFTKRPALYPGQGVWSSDGRSVVASLGISF